MESEVTVVMNKIGTSIDQPEYKLKDTHYANGNVLHSDQYYFAKKFFQNSENCKDIAFILAEKLSKLGFVGNTTLVGFREYLGVVLRLACDHLKTFNYEIIEGDEGNYLWRKKPVLQENIVIILPITCSCSSFFKIKSFINKYLLSNTIEATVNDNFINIFIILDESLEHSPLPIKIDEIDLNDKISKIYNPFNWKVITEEQILFYSDDSILKITANPLIKLYSRMYLPENCKLCFPDGEQTDEKVLFPTNINFESPNLIFGFPNFKKVSNKNNFFDVFISQPGKWHSHLYGNIDVNGNNYLNFIRANAFYEHNNYKILDFFDKTLNEEPEIQKANRLIIITPETKNSCTFLDDLLTKKCVKDKNVTILRFQPSAEFIDNFISIYKKSISERDVKIIYFEEVMTSAVAFKLLSDYITHCRHDQPGNIAFHGFDLVLTLIDRTTFYTKKEVLRKIESYLNTKPEEKYLAFYTLNSPIILVRYLGNPLNRRLDVMKKMMALSQIDSLRKVISEKIMRRLPRKLTDEEITSTLEHDLNFFPFAVMEHEPFAIGVWEIYKEFSQERLNLLRLYLTHEINSFFAQDTYQQIEYHLPLKPQDFLAELFEHFENKHDEFDNFFVDISQDQLQRNPAIEKKLIQESIVKLLSHYPFVYYKNIYEATFSYCVFHLNNICKHVLAGEKLTFTQFRELKFYVRRSVELNSSFIISELFLTCIKMQYENEKIDAINLSYENKFQWIGAQQLIDSDYQKRSILNLTYKWKQVNSYLIFLLFCYKDVIFKNLSRSIKLESLISKKFAYDNITPTQIIRESHLNFLAMLKMENIYPLSELKYYYKKDLFPRKDQFDDKMLEEARIYRHIFAKEKNDPIIINARKLIDESIYKIDKSIPGQTTFKCIKMAVSHMLRVAGLLEKRNFKAQQKEQNPAVTNADIDGELREILNGIMCIVDSKATPKNNPKLKYALFVDYRRSTDTVGYPEHIYSVTSENDSNVILNNNGLIYNMLYGLYDERCESRYEKTLLSAIRDADNQIISMRDEYFLKGQDNIQGCRSFSELYEKDLFDPITGKGLPMLGKSNMSIILRLSDVIIPNQIVKPGINGRAILVIMNPDEANIGNYLDFINIERLRLLLLLREDFISYLNKQFNNEAFLEVLESRKVNAFEQNLKHGLAGYTTIIRTLLFEYDDAFKKKNSQDLALLHIILNAMNGQLVNYEKRELVGDDKDYTSEQLVDIFRLMFESNKLNRYVDFNTVDLRNFNFNSTNLNRVIVNVIIPEIVINMKKYSPKVGDAGFKISYDTRDNTKVFRFENNSIDSVHFEKGKIKPDGGLSMSEKIMVKLGRIIRITDASKHIIELIINSKEDGKN